MRTIIEPQNNISFSSWATQYKEAIQWYKEAIWKLAEILKIGKENFGRGKIFECSLLTPSKIKWLIAIASTQNKNLNLLPDHHAEIYGLEENKQIEFLKEAEKLNLSSEKLRKLIRNKNKKITDIPKISVNSWSQHFFLLEKELKKLNPKQKDKIINHIKQKLS